MRAPLVAVTAALSIATVRAESRVYLGTGGGGTSKGIYVAPFDPDTGALGEPRLAAEVKNPSFLTLHPNGRHLYAVGEVWDGPGAKDGPVGAYEIQPDGLLKPLNQRTTGGSGPCFIGLGAGAKVALAANYGGGSVASFPVLADGTLGERASFHQHAGSSANPKRQKEPHAHSIYASPDGRSAFAPDLGIDKVMIYRIDAATGSLTPNDPAFAELPPGSGPRHLAFHPDGRSVHVINELLCTVTSFRFDAEKGALSPISTVPTLPEGVKLSDAFTTSEVVVHPNGKFVYGATRGHDSITVFSVRADGGLDFQQNIPCGGKIPRNINLDPSGRWLLVANQNSDNVSVLQVDPATGRLQPTTHGLALGKPMCIKFWAGAK